MPNFRTPRSLFLFVVILLLLDMIIGMLLKPYYLAATNFLYQDFYSRHIDHHRGDGFAVVFMGDSRTQHGVNSKYISRLCNCHAGNIALGGANMVTTYYVLRDYLEKNSQPQLIVLQTSWASIVSQPNGGHYTLLLEDLPARDQLSYFTASFDWNFAAKKILRSYRYREAVSRFLRGDKSIYQDRPAAQSENAVDEFSPIKVTIDQQADLQLELLKKFNSFAVPVDDAQLFYLEKILSLLQSKKITVIMVQPPEPREALRAVKNFTDLNHKISEKATTYNVRYLNYNDLTDPFLSNKMYFADEQHLNEVGADLYTKRLWNDIENSLKKNSSGPNQFFVSQKNFKHCLTFYVHTKLT